MSIRLLRRGPCHGSYRACSPEQQPAPTNRRNRVFPATLCIDDSRGQRRTPPFPTSTVSRNRRQSAGGRQRDISSEFPSGSPRFSRFSRLDYTFPSRIDPTAAGPMVSNLETTRSKRVFKDPVHEFVRSGRALASSGAAQALPNVGAEKKSFNSTADAVFGKGVVGRPCRIRCPVFSPFAITNRARSATRSPAKNSTMKKKRGTFRHRS